MSIEGQPHNEIEGVEKLKPIEFKMAIQREIIQHVCPPDNELDKCVDGWLDKNSENFNQIFAEESADYDEFLREWGERPLTVVDRFMEKLEGMPAWSKPKNQKKAA